MRRFLLFILDAVAVAIDMMRARLMGQRPRIVAVRRVRVVPVARVWN